MRLSVALVFLLPAAAPARDDAKAATIRWVLALEDPGGGFYLTPKDPRTKVDPVPGLRATSGAVRTLKYLGAEIPNKDRHAAFVLKCLDPKTGAFAEPGGKPDVTITSVGVMAAAELGIPKEKYAKAMDYLKENAKTFEDVRIAAAAVEAWGVKDCPFDLKPWFKIADDEVNTTPDPNRDPARPLGSVSAFILRLGAPVPANFERAPATLAAAQRQDGGWGRDGQKGGDIETTYRVMRALMLFKASPKDVKKLREFIASHRNTDGGYSTTPGEKSVVSGTYYATIITKWLDEMEKK